MTTEFDTRDAVEHEVFGNDDRQHVADTFAVPNRWVCAIDLFILDPKRGRGVPPVQVRSRGSGILIGPHHVLTARHVLDDVDHGGQKVAIDHVRVSPGRNGDNDKHPLGSATSGRFYRSPKYHIQRRMPVHDGSGGQRLADLVLFEPEDYALIVFERDLSAQAVPGSKLPLGWWGSDPTQAVLRRLDVAAVQGGDATLIGYPGDRCGTKPISGDAAIAQCARTQPDKWASTQWRSHGKVQADTRSSLLLYTIDSFAGESGAPLCLRHGGVLHLLGLHHGAERSAIGVVQRNEGVRVTRRMLADLVRWINDHAGRSIARVDNDTLLFGGAAPTPEIAEEVEQAKEAAAPVASAADLALLRRAAAQVEAGLQAAAAVLPKVADPGQRALFAFIVSLLRTHFFPRGHGLVDSKARLLRASRAARLQMQVEQADGSRWPFEHRLRLVLSARPPANARVAGEHRDTAFSSITLHATAFDGVSQASAAGVAVHETVHMLVSLVAALRRRFGDTVAQRFLAREPWRRLDLQPFETHRLSLRRAVAALLQVWPGRADAGADALADQLVEEALAYTLGQQLAVVMDAAVARRGPKVVWVSSSIAGLLLRQYVIDRLPKPAPSLTSAPVAAALASVRSEIEALTEALRQRWTGG